MLGEIGVEEFPTVLLTSDISVPLVIPRVAFDVLHCVFMVLVPLEIISSLEHLKTEYVQCKKKNKKYKFEKFKLYTYAKLDLRLNLSRGIDKKNLLIYAHKSNVWKLLTIY